MKRALFIDRDGTLVIEPPVDYQLDSLEKLVFYPKVFRNLYFIRKQLDFEFVMVTNQDGLGTDSFPEDTFWPAHDKMLKTLEGEGIRFDDILIDRSFPEENSPNRKPRTGMLGRYLSGEYDLANSYVIGDRLTDMQLAANLGAKGIWLRPDDVEARQLLTENTAISPVLITDDWDRITEYLFAGERRGTIRRTTKETDIFVEVNLDGHGRTDGDFHRSRLLRPYARPDRKTFGYRFDGTGERRSGSRRTSYDRGYGYCAWRSFVKGFRRQEGDRTLRLLSADGRLSVQCGA